MFESKYSGFLTALLVIVIIGIIGLLGYLGFTVYQSYSINKDTEAYVDAYIEEKGKDENKTNDVNAAAINDVESTDVQSSKTKKNKTYKGYNVVGTIEIPTIKVKYPILEKVTKGSIEVAVAVIYGPGPNQVGNTVIVGHNYRNGLFFSNNKKLKDGDKVYITDNDGHRVKYTIYKKFETNSEDTSFFTRNTNGAREITLSTCTDASNNQRIIIFAKADKDSEKK